MSTDHEADDSAEAALVPLTRHHHFRESLVGSDDRMARLELRVIDELVNTAVPDARRDSSIAWELKHHASVTQFARVMADRRGLDVELAASGALLHDIYAVVTGSYEDHARRGGPIAREIMESAGAYSAAEFGIVDSIVVNHSDKHIYSADPYAEFGKDVDILDCFLYPDSIEEYLLTKPFSKVAEYLRRARAIWGEMSLTEPAHFALLDDYRTKDWLPVESTVKGPELLGAVDSLSRASVPAALVRRLDVSDTYVFRTRAPLPVAEDRPTNGSGATLLAALSDNYAVLLWPAIGKFQPVSDAAYDDLIA